MARLLAPSTRYGAAPPMRDRCDIGGWNCLGRKRAKNFGAERKPLRFQGDRDADGRSISGRSWTRSGPQLTSLFDRLA